MRPITSHHYHLRLWNIKLQYDMYEIMNLFWLEVNVHVQGFVHLHASTPNYPSWKDPESPTFLLHDRRKVWVAPFIQVMCCALSKKAKLSKRRKLWKMGDLETLETGRERSESTILVKLNMMKDLIRCDRRTYHEHTVNKHRSILE